MLYVFHVDTGTMLTFDMNLATERYLEPLIAFVWSSITFLDSVLSRLHFYSVCFRYLIVLHRFR